jgi:hypothetical protein
MPEDGPDSLESRVRDLAANLYLWGYHNRDSKQAERGWPDWVILGPHGGLFRELKSTRGVLASDQRVVGAKLTAAGFDWAVWRPKDWIDGTIGRQLARIAGYRSGPR